MQKNSKTIIENSIVKFDSDTSRFLPISASRERKLGFIETRESDNLSITIKAFESLNYYDLIALFQMLDDYSKNNKKWEYQGTMQIDEESERILKKRTFDVKELCRQKGVSINKNNRRYITNSFERWYKAELIYQYSDENIINTRYIYEYKVDKKLEKMTIIANTNFLDMCLSGGMAMNWGRLVKYKNYYAIGLDIYLQFRSIKYTHGKKTKYAYPNIIKEETLFKHIGVEDEIKNLKHKREKVKKAFQKFEEVTGIKYIYSRLERKWIKESYFLKKQKN